MAHIVRALIKPGQWEFKVYSQSGSLMYHGSQENVAYAMLGSLKLQEEKRAREARQTGSDRSSD